MITFDLSDVGKSFNEVMELLIIRGLPNPANRDPSGVELKIISPNGWVFQASATGDVNDTAVVIPPEPRGWIPWDEYIAPAQGVMKKLQDPVGGLQVITHYQELGYWLLWKTFPSSCSSS